MSSRALRKAQKERERLETEQRLAGAVNDDADDESDNDDNFTAAPSKPSAFEMLSQMQDDGDDLEDDDQHIEPNDDNEQEDSDEPSATVEQQSSSRKKKKKKKKPAKGPPNSQNSRPDPDGLDEIDAALGASSLRDRSGNVNPSLSNTQANEFSIDEELELCRHLSIETYHLQVSNEMKRLFGRAAFEADLEDRTQSQGNRPQAGQGEGVGLADAVSGRLSKAGPGLPAMLRRRNIFVQGREEWPRQTGNGLSMEIESKDQSGITTYRFVHTKPYMTIQSIFAQCVAMMDPTNLINLLRYNPYHIGTLLQVSEIAKQERDHATSGELLERALFAFGKALHPGFAANLSQGKARLDFRRPENREFFLAAWRYIGNIGMRATWRTAYEWTRLLLSLDPIGDHYCIHLVIDQLALRAKQAKSFYDLVQTKYYSLKWSDLPNIQYSLGLAQRMIDGGSSPASEKLLRLAIQNHPWVAARLLQELGVDKIPPSVWGSSPPTDTDKLHSELYVTLGQDIWKPAEAQAFLTKTATSADKPSGDTSSRLPPAEITLDEARFVILTDKPPLIGLLPRALTAHINSMSDPLRPDDSIDSYHVHTPQPPHASQGTGPLNDSISTEEVETMLQNSPGRFIDELMELQDFFENLVPELHRMGGDGEATDVRIDALVSAAVAHSDYGVDEIRDRLSAILVYREVLANQAGGRVVAEDGTVATLNEDGGVRVVSIHDESAATGEPLAQPVDVVEDEDDPEL